MAPRLLNPPAMDLKYGLRSLRKNPGFTALAVIVMALGIGANTAVFSVVNAVLLKPLDYHDPDRIVTISNLWRRPGRAAAPSATVSAPDFRDWHDQNTVFEAIAYYWPRETAVRAGSLSEYARVIAVTPEFFRVFDVQPVVGRGFREEEQRPGSAGVAMVSFSYWQSRFDGKPDVLGKTVRLQDKALEVVGVLPANFRFPDSADIWYPANTIVEENSSRSSHNYLVAARLKPGATLQQAQSQMSAIATRLEQEHPLSNAGKGALVNRLRDTLVVDVRTTLYLLLGAVSLVLLIACANMANLLLAKGTARTREIAIRAAVGASRGRIVRQLVTESMILAVIAGSAGLLLAVWGASALVALAPSDVPRLAETGIDTGVLAFTLAISFFASLMFGLAPALQSSRVDLNHALKLGGPRSGGTAGKVRSALVVAEIALSVILLSGAGLFIKSFAALQNTNLGFRPEKLLLMTSSIPSTDLESELRALRFYKDLMSELRAVPGVASIGATRTPPGRVMSNGGYWVDHLPAERSVNSPQSIFSVVAPGTLATFGIPLKAGRDFSEADSYGAPLTAIVNETLARRSLQGENPIGHVIYVSFDSKIPRPLTIVGVAGDIRQYGPARAPEAELYMPYEQHPGAAMAMNVVARTTSDPTSLFETARRKAREISPDIPVRFTTMDARLAENVAAPRFRMLLLGAFAGLAVCLAMAGVYGVMSYVVGQRANEIGLRMALGASPGDVMGMVLGQGLVLSGIGVALGLGGALSASRLVEKMLFGVKPADLWTHVSVVMILAVTAVAATYVPARRAMKIDPLAALRQE